MNIRKYLQGGEYSIGVKPTEIYTVVNSCMAVCLYDRIEKIGGMGHYLVPLWNGNGLQSFKYGNIAIERLIEEMVAIGCRIDHLEAKIFGGGDSCEENSLEAIMVGKKNIVIAHEVLSRYTIPIVAEDVAGMQVRQIMFHSESGKVYLRYAEEHKTQCDLKLPEWIRAS